MNWQIALFIFLLIFFLIILAIGLYKSWFTLSDISEFVDLERGEVNESLIKSSTVLYNSMPDHWPKNLHPDFKLPHQSKPEAKCRLIFETLFQAPFICCKPDFLRSLETNRNLELDGYNFDLSLAFEYNGKMHYEYCSYFHKNIECFQKQLNRDKYKLEVCRRLNIFVIVIPYTVKDSDLPNFIRLSLPAHLIPKIKGQLIKVT